MCKNHDQLHYDQDTRAVAGTIARVDRAQGADLERARAIRDLLLKQSTVIGLLDFIDTNAKSMPDHVRDRCRVKLLSISARHGQESVDLMHEIAEDQDVPF